MSITMIDLLDSVRLLMIVLIMSPSSYYSFDEPPSIIKSNMNETVSPCDDFYEYACGNHTTSRKFSLEDASGLRERIRHSIEEDITVDDPKSFHKLQTYYRTCMDEEQIENNSENELRGILAELGGWPVLEESWDESNFDWFEIMFQFLDKGFPTSVLFVESRYRWDSENETGYILELYEPDFGIQMETLAKGFEEKTVKAYFNLMVNLAQALGANRTQAENDYQKVFEFMIEVTKVADAIPMKKQFRNTTIEQLQSECPRIPWLEFFSRLLKSVVQFDPMDSVIMRSPGFFEKYCAILEATPNRTLANLIFGRSVYSVIDSLGKRERKLEDNFLNDAGDRRISPKMENQTETPRWKECLSRMEGDMPLAVAALFVRKDFNRDTKFRVVELAGDIRRSTRDSIEQAVWLDNDTKSKALEKIDEMTSLIAYPDELLDDEKVDNYYEYVTMCNDSLLENRLRFGQLTTKKVTEELAKTHNIFDWTELFGQAHTYNAYYSAHKNVFLISAGILYQSDVWDIEGLRYLRYGRWGWITGHEISHGYDRSGSQFDKNGKLNDWWSPAIRTKYLEKTQCYMNQYDAFGLAKNVTVNGTLTLDENIADVEGLRLAYQAYDTWAQSHEEEPRLPGLEHLTPRQMFWVASANAHDCDQDNVFDGGHSPRAIRIIGPISNQQHFARDFNCPSNSPMDPFEKCNIW